MIIFPQVKKIVDVTLKSQTGLFTSDLSSTQRHKQLSIRLNHPNGVQRFANPQEGLLWNRRWWSVLDVQWDWTGMCSHWGWVYLFYHSSLKMEKYNFWIQENSHTIRYCLSKGMPRWPRRLNYCHWLLGTFHQLPGSSHAGLCEKSCK